jgi:hypothetical protein
LRLRLQILLRTQLVHLAEEVLEQPATFRADACGERGPKWSFDRTVGAGVADKG